MSKGSAKTKTKTITVNNNNDNSNHNEIGARFKNDLPAIIRNKEGVR